MFAIAGQIASAAALCGVCYAVASALAARNILKSNAVAIARFPPVTVLKPLHLAEAGLAENLESFFTQDYPSAVQIVFGVDSPDDSAIPPVRALQAEHPELDTVLTIGTHRAASNPKISNLIHMFPAAKHETLVLSDSDIRVPVDYLRRVVETLEQNGTGAASCLYRGAASGNFWSKMTAMGIDYQFLPGIVCGVTAGLASPFFGSTIALRKSVLAEIGGFEAFGDRLQDDYEIGRAVRDRKHVVAFAPLIVSHSCAERSAAEMLRHELRWARTTRTIDPIGYAASIITHTVPLGLMGTVLLGFSCTSLLTLAAALAARLFLKHAIDRSFGDSGSSAWLLLPRDVLSFAVFVGSFFGKRVDWQGQPYRVNAAGALVRE